MEKHFKQIRYEIYALLYRWRCGFNYSESVAGFARAKRDASRGGDGGSITETLVNAFSN